VYNTGGNEKGCVGRKKGYIYLSSGDFLVQILSFVSQRTQNGPAFILQNHMRPRELQALRRDFVLVERTLCDAGRYFCMINHFYHSDLMHLGAN
jgi:hypothetical protein